MKQRLLQRFVSVVECHQETREGATVCGHWKFPSTFIPLLTHTHTHTHTHRHTNAQDLFWKLCYINSTLFCQLHVRLIQQYEIRHQKHNTNVQLPHNGNNYHKTVTVLTQHFLWAVSKMIHCTAVNIPSAGGGEGGDCSRHKIIKLYKRNWYSNTTF